MKNIFLIGYFGFGNVGDELLLKQFAVFVAKYFPQCHLQVWGEPSDWTADLKLHWLPRKYLLQAFRAFLKSDAVIFPGGGLWQDHSGRGFSAWVYYGWAKLAELWGKPLVFFNQGIDGLKQSWLEQRVLDLFARARVAFLRETSQPSALLQKKPQVHIMPDALWASTLRRSTQHDQELGVCLSASLSEGDLKHFLGYLQDQKQFRKILLFNFFPQADSRVVEGARAVLDTFHQVTVVGGTEILERMMSCQKIVGSRYHSLILSLLLGIPFLGFFSELKSQRLAEQLQLPYLVAGQLGPKAPELFTQWLQAEAGETAVVSDVILRSQKAWETLNHVLHAF